MSIQQDYAHLLKLGDEIGIGKDGMAVPAKDVKAGNTAHIEYFYRGRTKTSQRDLGNENPDKHRWHIRVRKWAGALPQKLSLDSVAFGLRDAPPVIPKVIVPKAPQETGLKRRLSQIMKEL